MDTQTPTDPAWVTALPEYAAEREAAAAFFAAVGDVGMEYWRYTPEMRRAERAWVEARGAMNRVVCDRVNAERGLWKGSANELLDALEEITRCCRMTGPFGTTFYVISDARMDAANAAVLIDKGGSQ